MQNLIKELQHSLHEKSENNTSSELNYLELLKWCKDNYIKIPKKFNNTKNNNNSQDIGSNTRSVTPSKNRLSPHTLNKSHAELLVMTRQSPGNDSTRYSYTNRASANTSSNNSIQNAPIDSGFDSDNNENDIEEFDEGSYFNERDNIIAETNSIASETKFREFENKKENISLAEELFSSRIDRSKSLNSTMVIAPSSSRILEKGISAISAEVSHNEKKNSTQVSSNRDNRIETIGADGRRIIKYSNGTIKEYLLDGSVRVLFTNGDIKTTESNSNKLMYYYAESDTTHTSYPNGTEVYEFSNGQVFIDYNILILEIFNFH
jgi:hypothetical protein